MPTGDEHKKKYINNKKVLKLLNIQDKDQCDWIATIAFYSALHIIEKELAKENKHFRTHMEREQYINGEPKYCKNQIAAKYKQLSTNSKIARYGPGKITPTKANQMLRFLADIESVFEVNQDTE
jgi:hypothetical protein